MNETLASEWIFIGDLSPEAQEAIRLYAERVKAADAMEALASLAATLCELNKAVDGLREGFAKANELRNLPKPEVDGEE